MKDLSIIQTVPTRKGYLEKMGLVEMELKVSTWFMNICSDAVLVPQLYESSQVSMENLSLSPNCILECVKEGNNDEISSNLLETNNNLQREKTDSCEPTTGFIALELTSLEKPISGSVSKDG